MVIINLNTSLTDIDIIRWLVKANPEVKDLPWPGIEPQIS